MAVALPSSHARCPCSSWHATRGMPAGCSPGLSAYLPRFLVHLAQVVVYIYFTRIIVYLLESTLPFQLIWLAAAASEAATLAFYIAAGVSFRCASWHRASALRLLRHVHALHPMLRCSSRPGRGVADARRAASCWHPLPTSLQARPRTTALLQANAGGSQPLLPAD